MSDHHKLCVCLFRSSLDKRYRLYTVLRSYCMDRIFWPMLHMLSLNGGYIESSVAYLILDCDQIGSQTNFKHWFGKQKWPSASFHSIAQPVPKNLNDTKNQPEWVQSGISGDAMHPNCRNMGPINTEHRLDQPFLAQVWTWQTYTKKHVFFSWHWKIYVDVKGSGFGANVKGMSCHLCLFWANLGAMLRPFGA